MADELAAGDAGMDAFAQILAILDRLADPFKSHGDFIARDRWEQKPSSHPIEGIPHVEYSQDESLAEIWAYQVANIRRWAQAHGDAATEPAQKAARWLLGFGHDYLPDGAMPAKLGSDVGQLNTLVESQCPVECATCGKKFVRGGPGDFHCPSCKANRGNYGEIWTALHCHWHHGEQIRMHNPADWEDFRSAFLARYKTLPEHANKDWTPNRQLRPSDDSPPLWQEFEVFLRDRLLASGTQRDNWREALHRAPIATVTQWLRKANAAPVERSGFELASLQLLAREHAKLPFNGILSQLGKKYVENPSDENLERFAIEFDEYKAATADPEQEASRAALAKMTGEEFYSKFAPPLSEETLASSTDWSPNLPVELQNCELIGLCLTTQPRISQFLTQANDGRFFLVHWDSANALYQWHPVTPEYAEDRAKPVAKYRKISDWRTLFDGAARSAISGTSDTLAIETTGEPTAALARVRSVPKKPKRSTERGEAEAKLIPTLVEHHQCADGGCLNQEPIGNNELALAAEVERSSASRFFKKHFGSHAKYRHLCTEPSDLALRLGILNGELAKKGLARLAGEPVGAKHGPADEPE